MTTDEAIQLADMLRHTPEYGGTLMNAEIAAVVLAAEVTRQRAEIERLREMVEAMVKEMTPAIHRCLCNPHSDEWVRRYEVKGKFYDNAVDAAEAAFAAWKETKP